MPTAETLHLDSICTVQTVTVHYQAVASAFAHHASVSLDLSGVTDADVSLVQLVLAARETARRRGLPFTVTAQSSIAMAAFEAAGAPLTNASPTTSHKA